MRRLGFIRRLSRRRLARLREAARALILPWAIEPAAQQARVAAVVARVRAVAVAFAALCIAWIAVDLLAFERGLGLQLAAGRLTAAFAFVLIARDTGAEPTLGAAHRALALLFAVPLAFFLFAAETLIGAPGPGAGVLTAYAFLPLVVVACLGIFPLAALESLALAAPFLGASAVASLAPVGTAFMLNGGALWLVAVVAATAALAGMSQLRLVLALIEQSTRDALTRSLTRQAGEEMLAAQLGMAARHDLPLAVVFADLDRFKEVNDRFGHDTGDEILREAADRMRRVLRGQDVLIRWGGEEFLILLPNTDAAGAHRMLARLARAGLGVRPDGVAQTASFGIVDAKDDALHDAPDLVALADRRMYQAKQAGRNCSVGAAGVVPFAPAPASATPSPVPPLYTRAGRAV